MNTVLFKMKKYIKPTIGWHSQYSVNWITAMNVNYLFMVFVLFSLQYLFYFKECLEASTFLLIYDQTPAVIVSEAINQSLFIFQILFHWNPFFFSNENSLGSNTWQLTTHMKLFSCDNFLFSMFFQVINIFSLTNSRGNPDKY